MSVFCCFLLIVCRKLTIVVAIIYVKMAKLIYFAVYNDLFDERICLKMKKILAVLMILTVCISLAACGGDSTDKTATKVKSGNSDVSDDFDNDTEALDLKEDAKYVLVAIKTKYITVKSEEDFENLKVAYIGGTDGEAYAKYYDFKETGMYNAPNDLHSGITGKDFDVGLIDEEKLSSYDDWEVVWEMKQ